MQVSLAREGSAIVKPDYKKIKAEYIAGGTSYRKLAEKYDVPFSTLRKVAKREGWTQKRTQVEHKVDTNVTEQVVENETKRLVDIVDVADKLLDKISNTIDSLEVIDSQSLKHFTSALKDIKDIKGIKSDIDLKEQEARIAKLQKEAQAEEKDNEIQIIIGADAEDYSV